jgi:hypothetical protein
MWTVLAFDLDLAPMLGGTENSLKLILKIPLFAALLREQTERGYGDFAATVSQLLQRCAPQR